MTDPATLEQIVNQINRYGLAKVDERDGSLQLHRLVQDVIKKQLSPEEKLDDADEGINAMEQACQGARIGAPWGVPTMFSAFVTQCDELEQGVEFGVLEFVDQHVGQCGRGVLRAECDRTEGGTR